MWVKVKKMKVMGEGWRISIKVKEMNFNSEIMMNDRVLSSVKEVATEFAVTCVMECSRMYKFDGEEAVKLLGLRDSVIKMRTTKEKRVTDKAKAKDKSKYIFPYSGGRNMEVCQGLILNGGLFTQCEMSKKTQLYCGKCSKQAEKNSHGTPNYGTIMSRNSVGIMEYIDPSGKSPLPYMKFIKKKKWSLEEVQDEANKYGIEINEIHFVEERTPTKRGRKPRVRSQVAYDTDDESSREGIFETSIDNPPEEEEDESAHPQSSVEDDDISSQFLRLGVNDVVAVEEAPAPVLQEMEISKEEKQVEVMEVEEEKPAVSEVEEPIKEAPSKKEKAVKKSDKTEKQKQKEIEKQAKLNEKEMEKKKKEEEANAKKALAAAAKVSKSSATKPSSNSMDTKPSNTKPDVFCKKGKEPCIVVSPPAPATTPTPKKAAAPSVSVKPFTHNGVRYYKSPDNILYDKEGNPQGKWDETTKTINEITDEDIEEEEDDDDEDDNSEEEEEEYEEEEEQQGSARYASRASSEILDEIEYYECLESN